MPRLLICDDEPDSIALLIDFLERQELDIQVALNGADALDKARSGQPDLILLDVTMPGLDGYATCRRLKSEPATAGIPVIFLSGRVGVEDRLRGFHAGGADYIVKPFSADEVLARVGVHLHARSMLEDLRKLATVRGELVRDAGYLRDRLFTRALALVEEHLADPLSLAELARRVGTNERNLTDLFRRHVGMSVFAYLGERRLEVARLLLETSGLQIRQIADRVGYSNPGDLTRAFRRRFGVTPRVYRHNLGGPDEPDA